MKSVAMAVALVLAANSSALANNNEVFLIRSGDLVNVSLLAVEGSFNTLRIEQLHTGLGAANSVSLEVKGNRNGGPVGAEFSPVAAKSGLKPGSVVQSGFGNEVSMTVRGEDNLFAIGQVGNNNVVFGQVSGSHNQSAIMQTGNNNFASFTQNGIGNIVSVRQSGW